MNENKKNLLPPIVVDYIEKLSKKTTPRFNRESYCASLERIRDACDTAIASYNREKMVNKIARK